MLQKNITSMISELKSVGKLKKNVLKIVFQKCMKNMCLFFQIMGTPCFEVHAEASMATGNSARKCLAQLQMDADCFLGQKAAHNLNLPLFGD